MEQIHNALGAEGWKVRWVQEPGQALQAAAAEKPDLVIVSAAVAGAEAVTSSLSRRAGGPGVVGLLPEAAAPGGLAADELLTRPFSDQDLCTVVRRALEAGRAPAPPPAKLTSHDIFGDVLAEVESAGEDGVPAPKPAPAQAPQSPTPPRAAAPPPARPAAPVAPAPATPPVTDDINRRLEKTLSGVFGPDLKPRPPAPAPAAPKPAAPPKKPDLGTDDELDAILSKTLSSLDMGNRPKPAPPAPPAPPKPAQAAPPASPAPPPPRPAPSPFETGPRPITTGAPPSESTAVRKAPKMDLDLAELEELGRTRRKPDAPAPAPAPPAAARPAAPPLQPPAPAAAPPVAQTPAARPAPRPESHPEGESRAGRIWAGEASAPPDPSARPSLQDDSAKLQKPAMTPPPAAEPFGVRTEPIEMPPLDFSDLEAPLLPEPAPLPAPPPPEPELLPPIDIPRPSAPVSVLSADSMATQRIPIVPLEPEAGNQPGEPFGQYTLLEKIAVGGMAEVWKARMRGVEGFQKMVAIKKILPHMSDNSEFIGMFIDEAKLAAQLSHPNIVHIYDLGKIGRSYYIAMEYVDGRDLRSILNAGRRRGLPLPLGLALLIASRVASALDYAHRKRDFEGKELGLVHRDVSPQNVLISDEGDVKLCDFGIAKAVSKAGQTQMGALKGKLQYMSPEQAWGKAVDARSDIFSLGAVLFEMVTGERLFSGDSEMSVLESVRQGKTRSPREIDPSIPADVDEIVTRALAHQTQNRFQSAAEMGQRLETVLHGLSPTPGPTDLSSYIQRVLEIEPDVDADSAHFLLEPSPAPAVSMPAPEPAADLEEAPVAAVAPLGEVRVEETGRKGRGLLYAAIAVLLLAIVLTFFFLNRRSGTAAPPAEPPAAAPSQGASPGTAGTASTVPGGNPAVAPTPASPPVDVSGLVNEEVARKEAELRKQKEEKLKQLEQQLAQKNAPKAAPEETPRTAAVPPAGTSSPAAPEPAASSPEPAPAPIAQNTQEPEPEPEKPQEKPAPAPESPRVHTGDLVPGGPGVSPPALVSAPKPKYPPQARVLRVEGVVVVSVLVDENGRVQDARLIEPVPQKVGINEEALSVARNAQYRPATKDGVRVKMWTRLRIPFKM
jgi:TonB family protein